MMAPLLIKHISEIYLSPGVQTVLPMTVYMKGEIIMLTTEQKARIAKGRAEGRGYTAIARELSLNESTVRMYCVRNELTNRDLKNKVVCIQCGRSHKNGTKQFCSERCRSAWRRANHRLIETRYHHTCRGCGAEFETIGNKNQMYCSLRCYHSHRKGGAA